MKIDRTRLLDNQQYYSRMYTKESIILHHTAGTNAAGAIDWWNQTPDHVGTAYVIDRDGTIFETFDPKAYGYHLGIRGDDNWIEKHSIGIEIVAAGQLYKEGEKYMFYPLFPNKAAGREIPKEDVWDMGKEGWRGFRYYHKYTDEQITSTLWLCNKLILDFKIKVQDKVSLLHEYNDKIFKNHLKGIWGHSAVRRDKNDIVPFPSFMKEISDNFKQKFKVPFKAPKPKVINVPKSKKKSSKK